MADTTKISWTDATWNPWIGCTKVSPGCKNCYAERMEERARRDFSKVRRAKKFDAPLKWDIALDDEGNGGKVFTCSMSDFFHADADAWRAEAWEIIRRTPHLTYQILTKRPERIADHLPTTCFGCGQAPFISPVFGEALGLVCLCTSKTHNMAEMRPKPWPWPNVWLGTSVETQQFAEKRIPELINVPARVHFLSCEPLLGPIDFQVSPSEDGLSAGFLDDIEWVIIGGESGPGFREMKMEWAEGIRLQCQNLDTPIPVWSKQVSAFRSETPFPEGWPREMP